MKFVSYRLGQGEARVGVIHNDLIIDVNQLGEIESDGYGFEIPSTMLEFIENAPTSTNLVKSLIEKYDGDFPVGVAFAQSNATILAPIPRPRKNIFGIGLNYIKHVAESAKKLDTSSDLPKEPVIFSKPPTTVIGPEDSIRHNQNVTKQLDWEGELAVIIGKKACKVAKKDAYDYIFGYTIINDISARDCRRAGQWIVSKGQDTFAPMGPVIVTHDEIGDPQNLNLRTTVNGVEKQSNNTKNMLFDIRTLIEDVSSVMTLEPGDIIATGTPEGVGAGRDPQEFMWPGDVVEITIEKIGSLKNYIVNIT